MIAIDHGTRRTGFAVVDPLGIAPQPLGVYDGPAQGLLDHIAALLAERDVDTLLVGDPRRADGSGSARSSEIGDFVTVLRRRFPALEVVTHDERLTTREAESLLEEAGLHGKHRRQRRDAWSAWVLLRDWLQAGGAELNRE